MGRGLGFRVQGSGFGVILDPDYELQGMFLSSRKIRPASISKSRVEGLQGFRAGGFFALGLRLRRFAESVPACMPSLTQSPKP